MLDEINNITEKLVAAGWEEIPLTHRSHRGERANDDFIAVGRDRDIAEAIPACEVRSSEDETATDGSDSDSDKSWVVGSDGLPSLTDFSSFPSMAALRTDTPSSTVTMDCEWQTIADGWRHVLSYQFAWACDGTLHELVFLSKDDENDPRLPIDLGMGVVLGRMGAPSVDERRTKVYEYCVGWKDERPVTKMTKDKAQAMREHVFACIDGEWSHEKCIRLVDTGGFATVSGRTCSHFKVHFDYSDCTILPVTLLCHTGRVDISCLGETGWLKPRLTEVQGGLVSLKGVKRAIADPTGSGSHKRVFPVILNVRDTMCYAAEGKKSLKELGDAIGVPKIDVPGSTKAHMRQFLEEDPVAFLEYASNDSIVTLAYESAIWGWNNLGPATLTSAAATVAQKEIAEYLGCDGKASFERRYRGMRRSEQGKAEVDRGAYERPGYLGLSSLDPINSDVAFVQQACSAAYRGGFNACLGVGSFSGTETHDFDLGNAYPTSMCMVPDVDQENPILRRFAEGKWMSLDDFPDVLALGAFAVDHFEFPRDCKQPCISIKRGGVPVYPRTYQGIDDIWAAGPSVRLALALGARVHIRQGFLLRPLLREDGSVSYSLRSVVCGLVRDRYKAKEVFGKGSPEELILKVCVNSQYGKIAQNVVQKRTWDGLTDEMVPLGCSKTSNPVPAMMTTALTQCELIAAINELDKLGHHSVSVTTDGFITDATREELDSLDLCGLRPLMQEGRMFLTGDPALWEEKHEQDDLMNFTTRGNVSLSEHGVCAHAGTKSGYVPDSYEDRLWMMKQVVSRTGRVACRNDRWTPWKDIVRGKSDFRVTPQIRHISLDFDMKRKPIRESFHADMVTVDGETHEVACFDTEPYETMEEFDLYRRKAKSCKCLRTMDDWEAFFTKVDADGTGAHVGDDERTILMSVVMGHRAGKWTIPALENLPTVAEKVSWVNSHNTSGKPFTVSDWKNCRRADRQEHMLPDAVIADKLHEMMDDGTWASSRPAGDGIAGMQAAQPAEVMAGPCIADVSKVDEEPSNATDGTKPAAVANKPAVKALQAATVSAPKPDGPSHDAADSVNRDESVANAATQPSVTECALRAALPADVRNARLLPAPAGIPGAAAMPHRAPDDRQRPVMPALPFMKTPPAGAGVSKSAMPVRGFSDCEAATGYVYPPNNALRTCVIGVPKPDGVAVPSIGGCGDVRGVRLSLVGMGSLHGLEGARQMQGPDRCPPRRRQAMPPIHSQAGFPHMVASSAFTGTLPRGCIRAGGRCRPREPLTAIRRWTVFGRRSLAPPGDGRCLGVWRSPPALMFACA